MIEKTLSPFQLKLKKLMDVYVHFTYKLTRKFPSEERFGAISQLRRSVLSVPLNYIEGYSRRKKAVQLNFYETSYASLNESIYLHEFSWHEAWMTKEEYDHAMTLADEIGAMLWSEIQEAERVVKNQ